MPGAMLPPCFFCTVTLSLLTSPMRNGGSGSAVGSKAGSASGPQLAE